MSKVIIWDGGGGGAAQVAGSSAIMLSHLYQRKILLSHTDVSDMQFEQGFVQRMRGTPQTSLHEQGMTALHRLWLSGRLTPVNFENYTVSFLQGKLDLVCGEYYSAKHQAVWSWNEIKPIMECASGVYDNVMIQLSSSVSELSAVMKDGGHLIVVLRQDRSLLDRFFGEIALTCIPQNATYSIVIYDYDHKSKWNLGNIRRKYKTKAPLIGVPHYTPFMDAWNEGDIVGFFRKHQWMLRKNVEKRSFMSQYGILAKEIIERSDPNYVEDGTTKGA